MVDFNFQNPFINSRNIQIAKTEEPKAQDLHNKENRNSSHAPHLLCDL